MIYAIAKWQQVIDQYTRVILKHVLIQNCQLWAFDPHGLRGEPIKTVVIGNKRFGIDGWENLEDWVYHYTLKDTAFWAPTMTAVLPMASLDACEHDVNEVLSTMRVP